ncbi:hypothetical protein ASZ78_011338 [Callipepla squamata]|uniref:VLRF1 domain-containing protein n=1 Tax=Callipepla squamata TaxID=9009 RepID=A0A226NP73_CALSU|nr:hypothetical protein ASZ78_011338 [Callipepla squamata]
MPAPESRSVFHAAQDPVLLCGLSLVSGFAANPSAAEPAPARHEKPAATHGGEKAGTIPEVPERMCCSTCGQEFGSREEQTEHYRLDWHRFNLKQRLQGHRALPVEEFEEKSRAELLVPVLCAQDSMNPSFLPQDIQGLLAAWAQHLKEAQRIFLRAPRHNRALLFDGRNPHLSQSDPRVCHIPLSTRRATLREVLRVHGVLSSLQVFGKDTPLEDITGSPWRGWQKKQRAAEVDTLQTDTAPEEEEEEEEESPSGELETVEVTLGTLDLREFEVVPKRNRKRRKKRNKKMENGLHAEKMGCCDTQGGQPGLERVTELQGNLEAEPLPWGTAGDPQTQLRDALFTACKTGDVGTLRHLLAVRESRGPLGDSKDGDEEQPLDLPHSLLNQPVDEHGFTLLHVAARAGKAEAVCLLLEAGADPALRDKQERTPYCISADKPTRNAFRKFMVDHPDKYDYSRAKVPGPLTVEMEARKLEKKRAQKAQRKQREQAQREEQQRVEQEKEEKQRFAALSNREKRALAAERRLAEQMKNGSTALSNISRCWYCGESLLGRIPFHYLDFSFCSTACLQTHRRAQASHT